MNNYVIMCVYKRLERLSITIDLLKQQKCDTFTLVVWNNSKESNLEIENRVSNKYFNTIVLSEGNNKNVGGIGRFMAAKLITNKNDKIIFIDDDQIFDDKMIKNFLDQYEPNKIKSWWAFYIKSPTSYHNRNKITEKNVYCNYCGTGGMILDGAIFLDEGLFDIPLKFVFIEDLWLSFYARCVHNYSLEYAKNNITIEVDGKDQFLKIKILKNDFLKYMIQKLKWYL